MRHLIPSFAALGLIASLGACSTIPVGGSVLHISGAAYGLTADGMTQKLIIGGASTQISNDPIVTKDGKGNVSSVAYRGPCDTTGPAEASFIDKGSATANTQISTGAAGTTGGATPMFNGAIAINQGLVVGYSSILAQAAGLQAAVGPNHPVLLEMNACGHAKPNQETTPALGTPIP